MSELHDLIRQFKTELEWAVRTGIDPTVRPPRNVVRKVEPREPPRPVPGGPGLQPEVAPSPDPASIDREPPALEPPAPEPPALAEAAPLQQAATLQQVREVLGDCQRCKLSGLGRRNIVFGVGNENADVMFVGEGPGAEEDRRGEPFVGKAGQLLTAIIEKGMGLRRDEVYIANIVKCRPPQNRDPEPDEVEQCEPFLQAQIRVVQPRLLITLGKYAAHTLLRVRTPITKMRGQWSEYRGIPLMPTYHPAYLLRNPAEKRPVWEDIQEVLKCLGRPVPGSR